MTSPIYTSAQYRAALAGIESNNNYSNDGTNPGGVGAYGAYSARAIAFKDIGWQTSSGQWTPLAAANGVTSYDSFVSNVQAQETFAGA